jgi:hypothetical protein
MIFMLFRLKVRGPYGKPTFYPITFGTQCGRQSRGSHVQKGEAASSEKSSNDVKEMLFQLQKDMGLMKERFEQKQSNVAQTHYQGAPPQNSGRSTGRQPP